MGRLVVTRLVAAVPVLLVASLVVFGAMRLLPGDPLDALFPPTSSVSPEARQALREQLGLDRPLPAQYLFWLGRVAQGDLGVSVRTRQPVTALLAQRIGPTLLLVAVGTTLGVAIAVPVGVVAALRRGSAIDQGVSMLALLGLSVPVFVLGTLLALVFGVWLRWVPTAGHLALPAVTLGLGTAGFLVRNVRSGVLDELHRDHVRTAHGKGLPRGGVNRNHVLRNALPVTIAVFAANVGYQLGGAVVVEQVFAWPGLGRLLFEAIAGRDYPVVQAVALFAAVAFVVVNLIADLARAALDPRLQRTAGGG